MSQRIIKFVFVFSLLVLPVIAFAHESGSPNVTQTHYSLRDDDGSETAASFLNTDVSAIDATSTVSIQPGIAYQFRIRFQISNEGTANAAGTTYDIQFAETSFGTACSAVASGDFTTMQVNQGVDPVHIQGTSYYTVNDASTNCTATASCDLTDENATFVAGDLNDGGGVGAATCTTASALTSTEFSECEFLVRVDYGSVNNSKICFRLSNVDTYNVYPSIGINNPSNVMQDEWRWRLDDGAASSTVIFSTMHPTSDGWRGDVHTSYTGCTTTTSYDCFNDQTSNAATGTVVTNDGDTSFTVPNAATNYRYTFYSSDGSASGTPPRGSTVSAFNIKAYAKKAGGGGANDLVVGVCPYTLACAFAAGASMEVESSPVTISNTGSYTEVSYASTTAAIKVNEMTYLSFGFFPNGSNMNISQLFMEWYINEATWLDSENVSTGFTMDKGTTYRLRVQLRNTGGGSTGGNYQIEYAARSGTCDTGFSGETYTAIPTTATTEHFEIVDSEFFAQTNDRTIADVQLSKTANYSEVVGEWVRKSNQTAAIDLGYRDQVEIEYAFTPTSNATDSGVYCFRITNGGVALDTYNYVASSTISAPAASLTFTTTTNNFPNLTPGSPVFATTTLSVDTDNSAGWYVTLARDDTDTTLDLDSDATVNITDQTGWIPGAGTTTAGNAVRLSSLDNSGDALAFRVMTASGSVQFRASSWWGTTDAYADDVNTLWAGIEQYPTKIGDSSIACSGTDCALNTVLYYLDVAPTQQTGTYSGDLTYTATAN